MSTDTIRTTLGMDSSGNSLRKKKLLWGGGALLVAAAAAAYLLYGRDGELPRFESEPALRKTLTTTVSATGNLEPTNRVDVGIEVSGTIKEVLVDYNDRVRAGAVMARLDTTRLASALESSKAALMRAQANVAEAKASLTYARNEWKRVEGMYASTGGNYPSQQALDEAKTSLERAKAQHEAALAQVKQASDEVATNRYNLDRALVVSPIEGIVLERKVEPGQTVVASMQTPVLFTMAEDLTKMRVILSIDEADIGEVRERQKVRFGVDAYPEREFEGIITQLRLNSEILNGVVTYDAVVEVDNNDLLLRPGMTVSAHITTGVLENVLAVPNAALRFSPPDDAAGKEKKAKNTLPGQHVWVLREGKPERIPIKTLKSDGTYTAVSGIREGEHVLTGVQKP